jgi:hypothetical protein
VCSDAKKSAIRACTLRENARKKLVGEGEEASLSIFFSSLLDVVGGSQALSAPNY